MNRVCATCGTKLEDSDAFCSNCGSPTAQSLAPRNSSSPTKNSIGAPKNILLSAVAVIVAIGIAIVANYSSLQALFSPTSSTGSGTDEKTTISAISGAPVVITNCSAQMTRTRDAADSAVYHLKVQANYNNITSKDIATLQIAADAQDSFGKHIKTFGLVDSDAQIAANASSTDNSWTFDNVESIIASLTCSVSDVKFADGTTWSAPSDGTDQ